MRHPPEFQRDGGVPVAAFTSPTAPPLHHCPPPLFTTTIGSTVRREKHVDKSTIVSAEEMEGLRRINAWDIKLYGKSRDGVPILGLPTLVRYCLSSIMFVPPPRHSLHADLAKNITVAAMSSRPLKLRRKLEAGIGSHEGINSKYNGACASNIGEKWEGIDLGRVVKRVCGVQNGGGGNGRRHGGGAGGGRRRRAFPTE